MEKLNYQPISNKIRVVHFPQVGSCKEAFRVEVKDEEQANLVVNTIANQHAWLYDNNIIPDYSNAIFVEMLDESNDWVNYYNEKEEMEFDELQEAYFSQPGSNV